MIEKVILDYLDANLNVDVYLEMPEDAVTGGKYVVFERTGSRKENGVYESTFAFQSYAPSLYEAAALNALVEAVVESLIALDEISASKLNSSYNFTDVTTKQYRYQCVYDITHYER